MIVIALYDLLRLYSTETAPGRIRVSENVVKEAHLVDSTL